MDPLAERGVAPRAQDGPGSPPAAGPGHRLRRAAAMTIIAATNVEALVIFAIVLVDHARRHLLGVPAHDRRGRRSGPPGARSPASRTACAISGDYLSAASFLGIAGLIFIFGFDGFLYSVGFLVAFLTVMFLLAERMRNAGKYTIADVLAAAARATRRAARRRWAR